MGSLLPCPTNFIVDYPNRCHFVLVQCNFVQACYCYFKILSGLLFSERSIIHRYIQLINCNSH